MARLQRFRGEGVRATVHSVDANMQGMNRFARRFGVPPDVEKELNEVKRKVGDVIAMMQMGQKKNYRGQ